MLQLVACQARCVKLAELRVGGAGVCSLQAALDACVCACVCERAKFFMFLMFDNVQLAHFGRALCVLHLVNLLAFSECDRLHLERLACQDVSRRVGRSVGADLLDQGRVSSGVSSKDTLDNFAVLSGHLAAEDEKQTLQPTNLLELSYMVLVSDLSREI